MAPNSCREPSEEKCAIPTKKVAVVVPSFNEELLIEETLQGIPDYVYRIYVIDDGSTDKTPDIVADYSDSRVVSIRHETNLGVGAAIATGYRNALKDGMDIVAVMAGDNQMDPEKLSELISPIADGSADYSKGNRLLTKELRRGMSRWRYLGNMLLTMITKICSGYWSVSDPQNGYTAISAKALQTLDLGSLYPYYGYCNDLLIKLNALDMIVVDVPIAARYGREESKIRYGRYIAKVSPMLLSGFIRRLKDKHTANRTRPPVPLNLQ